jgi:hypothetical protein
MCQQEDIKNQTKLKVKNKNQETSRSEKVPINRHTIKNGAADSLQDKFSASPVNNKVSENIDASQYVVIPACLPLQIFKPSKNVSVVKYAERVFQGEKFTVRSRDKLALRELRVFLALISLLMQEPFAVDGNGEASLESVRISDIKKMTNLKSNYFDIKSSLESLEHTILSIDNQHFANPLIRIESDDQSSLFNVCFHWLIIEGVRSCFKVEQDVFTPFTIIYISEQNTLSRGRYSEIALLIHAYFSQSVTQGKMSAPHSLITLAKKIFEIDSDELKRQHITSIKKGLERFSEIGWQVVYRPRSIIQVARPNRQKIS